MTSHSFPQVNERVGSVQVYAQDELDFEVQGENIIDYWEKLEHQYAGMAMQGIIARHNVDFDMVVEWSADLAHALVEKLKSSDL